MRLEPALRNVEPDRDDLHRLSLLRSSTAGISDAATGYRQREPSISLLKGHVGMAPVRKRNFGQLGAAVRLAHDRVAEIEAFESALDVSLRVHGPMLIEVAMIGIGPFPGRQRRSLRCSKDSA